MSRWPLAQVRHITRFEYGDSLAAENRVDGPVPVYGSNGPVGSHDQANTGAPAIVIGRKGSYGQVNFSHEAVFAIDTTYFVDPSTTSHDIRWLYYALSTAGLTTLGQDVGVPGLNRDLAYGQRVPLPPLAEQRAIADYLDAETARIDALIAKKQQLIHLLEERREIAFDKVLGRLGVRFPDDLDPRAARSISLPAGWRMVKLSSALRQLTNGYVGPTRDILVDEGIRYIQGLHIKRGAIDFDRRPFFVTELWHRARPRTSLRPGDVVIVQTGDIGQCAVVPDGFGEANCHALLIARANENVTDGQYLAAYLQSRFGRHSLLRLATGALHPHLEFGIRDAPLLLPPRASQSELVNAVADEKIRLDATAASVGRQIDLLVEHRQALLTAAVTGELSV